MLRQRGHSWSAIAGAFLWVLRARFFRFDVRRFGTAIGGQLDMVEGFYSDDGRAARSASQRLSVSVTAGQPQGP